MQIFSLEVYTEKRKGCIEFLQNALNCELFALKSNFITNMNFIQLGDISLQPLIH